MIRALWFSCIAAILGVVTATGASCGIGLANGTDTWCGFGWVWPFAFPIALFFALVAGFPAALVFRKLGLKSWWQFFIAGGVISLPVWLVLAQPFSSPRWQSAGFYDSLNYLGAGAMSGLWLWLFLVLMPSNTAVKRDAPQAARPLP